jgi:hypothetical protein
MLKRIPKSDISIRPFKAYKEWSFNEIDSRITVYEANETSSLSSSYFPQKALYGQLRAQFYNGHEDNPFLRFGVKSTNYATGLGGERFITGSAKIISIPQKYIGEGIKKGSVRLFDDSATYADDGLGSLIGTAGDTVTWQLYNNNNDEGILFDFLNNQYNVTINSLNLNTGQIILTYNTEMTDAIISSFNIDTGIMVVNNFEFLLPEAGSDRVGNVFYNQGLIVLTKEPSTKLVADWDLTYKSTKTIYEHEYLLIVNPDEFNISQNPSAVQEVGFEYEYVTGSDNRIYKVNTKTGARYIRKKLELENGNTLNFGYGSRVDNSVSGGFEHYDISGSSDSTGSFLAPYITTIGLYDNDMDLVAVAKLPQPIKSEPDFPVNFIVRFDI